MAFLKNSQKCQGEKNRDGQVEIERVYYPHHMDDVPQRFLMKAESELFETPQHKKICMENIKNLIRNEEGMKEGWFNDDVILMYLRSRKFDVHKAFSSMKRMVSCIKKNRGYFEPIDPKAIEEILKSGVFELLPRRDSEGCTVFVCRINAWDTSKTTYVDFFHCAALMALNGLNEPMAQINGMKLVASLKCNPLKYIRFVTPFHVFLLYQLLIECIPLRAKAVHGIYPSIITKLLLSLIRAVASDKIKKRIMVHDKPADISPYVQLNIIPTDMGGTLPKSEETRNTLAKTLTMPDYVTAILEDMKST